MAGANQLDVLRQDVSVSREDLLRIPEGTRTEEGLRHNVRVGIQYIEAWLRGNGCVPLYNLMEDAATAEISRAQVWQWLHHGAAVDGVRLDKDRFARVVDEEMQRVRREVGEARFQSGRFADARDLFVALSTSPKFEDFLTLVAYERLEKVP
jgi:malate synthase